MLVLESFVCVPFSFYLKLGKSLQNVSLRLNVNNAYLRVFSLQELASYLKLEVQTAFSRNFIMKILKKKLMLLTCTLFFVYSANVSSGPLASFLNYRPLFGVCIFRVSLLHSHSLSFFLSFFLSVFPFHVQVTYVCSLHLSVWLSQTDLHSQH